MGRPNKEFILNKLSNGLNYVFFINLLSMGPEIEEKARSLNASLSFDNKLYAGAEQDEFSIVVKDAIDMLNRIALSEEQKEILALKTFSENIKTAIQGQNNEFTNKISQLIQKINNNEALNNSDLITNINIVVQEIKDYQLQLDNINKDISSTFAFLIQGNVEKFLLSQETVPESARKQYEAAGNAALEEELIKRNKLLHSIFYDELNTQIKNIANTLQIPEEIFYSAIFIDFTHKFQEYLTENEEQLRDQFQIYLKQNTPFLSTFQAAIASDDVQQAQLERILKGLSKAINAGFLTQAEVEATFTYKNRQQNKFSERQQRIFNSFRLNAKPDEKRFVFSFHTRTSHGNFFETVGTILRKAINVQANVGADLLVPLGELELKLPELTPQIEQLLSDDFKNQPKQLALYAEETSKATFQKQIERQRQLTKNIEEKIKLAQDKIRNIETIASNFFITHESLKLYADANSTGLHGRTMKILSALAKLSTETPFGIDTNDLIPYILNLKEDTTLGGENEAPLETYLSLFAALLMFDDIGGMVNDAIKNISQPSIHQLHVYNINGTYYPVSVLLKMLCESIQNVAQIDSKVAATVNIQQKSLTVPKIGTTKWENLANKTIQSTNIKILFSAALIKTLEEQFIGK